MDLPCQTDMAWSTSCQLVPITTPRITQCSHYSHSDCSEWSHFCPLAWMGLLPHWLRKKLQTALWFLVAPHSEWAYAVGSITSWNYYFQRQHHGPNVWRARVTINCCKGVVGIRRVWSCSLGSSLKWWHQQLIQRYFNVVQSFWNSNGCAIFFIDHHIYGSLHCWKRFCDSAGTILFIPDVMLFSGALAIL